MVHRRWHCYLWICTFLLAGKGQAFAQKVPTEVTPAWTQKALYLQRQMDLDAPLVDVVFPHTHNSYNSRAYANGLRYIDPNHYESIYSQLTLGIRSIELDVHYTTSMAGPPWKWGKKLLLCHGTDKHVGCHARDRRLEEGLEEIAAFLSRPENSQEILIIYIEDHMDGRHALVTHAFEKALGSKIFRPDGNGCQGIPMHLSKREILASGRNVLLMGGHEVCSSQDGWSDLAFAGVGDYLSGSYPTASFDGYADGSCDATFSRDFYAEHWIRVQEDRTTTSRVFGHPGKQLTARDIQLLGRCRVNLIGLDKVTDHDARLAAYVWSWDFGQPTQDPSRLCAVHQASARLRNDACSNVRAFACKNAEGAFYITSEQGPWSEGPAICSHETAGEYSFSLPVNSFDNENLRQIKGASADVWINFHDTDGRGAWATSR